MSLFARFRSIDEDGKAHAVRSLMESSTPSFDYFYMVALAVTMATLGLLAGSTSVVIGSMLIAPVLYPLLSFSLGLVMSDYKVLMRSTYTLLKSIGLGIGIAMVVTFVFAHGGPVTDQILERTQPSLLYLFVAIVAGLGVAYALARPDWNETIPGIAVSVALIPPLATVGIGIARFDFGIASGAFVMLFINVLGIVVASMVTFSLMNLYEKRHIAQSTIEKVDERIAEEHEAMVALDDVAQHPFRTKRGIKKHNQ